MTKNKTKGGALAIAGRTLTVALLCIALLASLTSCIQYGGNAEPLSRDELIENINRDTSEAYDYAAEYFDLWELPLFNMTKLKTVEKKFRDNSALPLPSVKELAKATALHFLDVYYEGDNAVDLSDRNAVTDALLYSFVYKTGDIYAFYRTASATEDYGNDMSGEFCGIGVTLIRYPDGTGEITEVYKDSGAYNAGISAGDVLIGVGGIDLTPENQQTLLDSIQGEAGTTIDLTLKRGMDIINVTVTRSHFQLPSVEYEIQEAGEGAEKIGYIRISSFKANTDEQFIEAIDFMEQNEVGGIIFDLRGNPGGYLDSVVNSIDYLVPAGNRIVSYKLNGSPEIVTYSKSDHTLNIPSVVLCDQGTASAGELFCSALRDYNDLGLLSCTLVGQTTYGKGVMQSTFGISDGSSVTFTTAYYNPPCGENYDKTGPVAGITPDILMEGTAEQDDEALTALLELISAQSESDQLKSA